MQLGRRLDPGARAHDDAGLGGCTNTGACATACPNEIPLDVISQLNHDYLAAKVGSRAAS